jgi:hypothetical protein
VLAVASYKDSQDIAVMAMFLELVIMPIARGMPEYSSSALKNLLLSRPITQEGMIVRDTIINLLEVKIDVEIPSKRVSVAEISDWMLNSANTMVRLLLFFNDVPTCDVPAVQYFIFTLETAHLIESPSPERV